MATPEYSQIVRRKLKALRNELTQNYGEKNSKKIMNRIARGIRQLELFPQAGTKISSKYSIKCDYSFIFIEHNYFFYRIKGQDTVLVLEMFHEKEDFMRKLFGIITTPQETLDYWKE